MTSLRELINKYSSEPVNEAHVYGSAKSVIIARKYSINGLKFAVGDMPWRAKDLGPYDFWVTNNTYFPIPWKSKDLKIIKSSKAITLISTHCANLPSNSKNLTAVEEVLRSLIQNNSLILYDAYHFGGNLKECQSKPCAKLYKIFSPGESIQEELSKKFEISELSYLTGHATLNAIALAILFNCKNIFIHGVELPVTQGSYSYYKQFRKITTLELKMKILLILQRTIPHMKKKPTDFAGEAGDQLLKDFESVGILAASIGANLYVTSPTSPLIKLNGFSYHQQS
jgi:hypothetical protein